MRLRHLRYFLVVAEEQSFARAAARVHIEPSPLSRAIKELEVDLGVCLFDRTKGRIRLTWAGEVFRDEARRMLTFMDAARSHVRAAARGFRGRLRIGLADRLVQPRLIQLLALCREEEPLTEIRIVELTVSEMSKALCHDQIDAGFSAYSEPGNGLRNEMVWTDRPAVAIPRNHPLLSLAKVPLQEVVRYPLILCHPELCSGGHDVMHRWILEYRLPKPVIAEYVSGHDSMVLLVAAGYGIAVGLDSQLALYKHPGVIIRPVADDVPSAATFIATLDQSPSPELSRFIARAHRIGTESHAP